MGGGRIPQAAIVGLAQSKIFALAAARDLHLHFEQ